MYLIVLETINQGTREHRCRYGHHKIKIASSMSILRKLAMKTEIYYISISSMFCLLKENWL